MLDSTSIDGVLVQWGDRLFYPGNRVVKKQAAAEAQRICRATASDGYSQSASRRRLRQAPQVMVKVTGGGRGMKAIAAHFRYISKNGRIDVEDDRGQTARGKEAVHGLVEASPRPRATRAEAFEARRQIGRVLAVSGKAQQTKTSRARSNGS